MKKGKKEVKMPAKKSLSDSILSFLAWFAGVILSLVVGNAMIEKTLVLPWWLGGEVAPWIAVAVGWIVIVTTLVGAVMAIIKE